MLGGRGTGSVLPFGPGKSPWAGGAAAGTTAGYEAQVPEETGTVSGVTVRAHDVLPMPWNAARPRIPEMVREVAPAPEPVVEPSLPPQIIEPVAAAEPPPIGAISIECCAAIRASIAVREAETAQILAVHGLDATEWAALDQRWNDAVGEETEREVRTLLDAYDAAYVAQIEAERGPITVAEHAMLLGSAGRRSTAPAIGQLRLPEEAFLRIKRSGLRRMSADPAFATELAKALAERMR